MYLEKILNEFVDEYMTRGTYAEKNVIFKLASEMKEILSNNKDRTPEEIISAAIVSNVVQLEDVIKKYGVPGYTASINVDNINVKLYGGNINYLGEKMPENALFDIASMTKFYTQCVIYNLIKEGIIQPKSVVSEIDPRFSKLGDLTIFDITSFMCSFKTPGRIDDKESTESAKEVLFNSEVVGKGIYNYNDIGMMILKEVAESQTGMTYQELVDKYILEPLNLKDTHLIVPNNKYKLLTGSPIKNAKQGLVNDSKASILGGFSGHAGMWASSDDLIKLVKGVHSNGVVPNISAAYTSGLNSARGIMGNTYTTHPKGLNVSYLDITEPYDAYCIQGSTRVNAIGSKDHAQTVLFNPASMSIEEAKEKERAYNEMAKERGKNEQVFVKQFQFDSNGKFVNVDLIDPRQIFPSSAIESVIEKNAELSIKLRFLNKVLKDYYNYKNEVEVINNGKLK